MFWLSMTMGSSSGSPALLANPAPIAARLLPGHPALLADQHAHTLLGEKPGGGDANHAAADDDDINCLGQFILEGNGSLVAEDHLGIPHGCVAIALGRVYNRRAMEYDYIIAGAGTAGCVLANRLSANRDASVMLIEAGGKDDYFWIDIPVGYLYTIGNPRTDWCYETEPEPGLGGRRIGYARGKVLGGCSSINAMIYMRGQRSDYDHWAQLGNRGWSWDEVLPVFKRSEDYQHGADEYHGAGGELRVEERRRQLGNSRCLAVRRRRVRHPAD